MCELFVRTIKSPFLAYYHQSALIITSLEQFTADHIGKDVCPTLMVYYGNPDGNAGAAKGNASSPKIMFIHVLQSR